MKLWISLLGVLLWTSPLFSQEICDNGIDDDGDGLIDCYDPDCHDEAVCYKPFICNPDAFLFQNSVTDVYKLTVASGESTLMVDNLEPGHRMNGIGFNVKDGCIWGGVPTQTGKVGRVDSTYTTMFFEIDGLPLKKFYVGDVDTSGVLFLYHSGNMHQVDVNPYSENYLTLLGSTSCSPGNIHDWVFNPVDQMLYAVEKGNNRLKKIDPATGSVTNFGSISTLNGINSAFGAVYTDLLGNMFISTNSTGKIYRINQVHNVTQNSDIDCTLFALGPYSNQNDGCMCSLTLVPIEICGNGTDDDGDGLIDCEDPACWADSGCVEVCGDDIDNDGDGLVDLDDPDVDADGDGICVDVDPDDNDACNPSPSVGCLEGQCGTNIAVNGTASQSSTESNNNSKWGADNAIDGNTSGTQNNMILTQFDYNSWWELDLGAEEQIDEIRIWNRTDANPERLEQFYVFISSSPFASTDLATTVSDGNVTSTYIANSPNAFVILQPGITGRYIRVQLLNQERLHMAELEVIQYGDTSDPEYNTLGSWDDHGIPNYLNTEYNGVIDADFMEDMNYMFGYGKDLYSTWPYITQSGVDRHIDVVSETCLNLTLVASALTQDEALAYYTYPTGSTPTSLDACDLTIVSPNMAAEGWSNGLAQGYQIDLGTFSAGTSVGFVVLHQAWNGTTNNLDDAQYTFASEATLNPETNYPDHIMAVADGMREMVHFAVEAGLTPEISVSNTDKDFADLFFSVSPCDYSAIDVEDMPGALYTTIGCNSVPTGLDVTNIGLWRGNLEWDDLVGADSYRIRFREYGSGASWEYRNMGTDTEYLLSQYNADINPGTMYEWQVASTCDGVQTGNSVINVFETRYPCEMPSSSWLSDITSTSVRVNWTQVNYATTYKVAYYETGDELNTQWRNAGSGTYFDITGLEPNTEYNYRVGAWCDEFPSCMHPYLHAISFTTLAEGGMAPPLEQDVCVELRSEAQFELVETVLPSNDGPVQIAWFDVNGQPGMVLGSPSGGSSLKHVSLAGMSVSEESVWNLFHSYTHMDVRNADGQGSPEVLLTDATYSTASVYGWDGGSFRPQAMLEQHPDAGFDRAILAQMDDDQALELIAVNSNVNKLQVFEPELLEAREDEEIVYTYVPGERLISYDSPTHLQAFDLNGDGLDELGVQHLGGDFLTVHYNGDPQDSLYMTKILCPLEGPATGFDHGYMDLDTATEVAMISKSAQTLEIYAEVENAVGPGIGKKETLQLPNVPSWVKMMDVDANGRMDVLVGLEDLPGMLLYQSLSSTELILDEGVFIPLPQIMQAALVRDLNNDNLPDLALAGVDGSVYLYQNTTVNSNELAVVTVKQAQGQWSGTLNDVQKDASYHWERWNGEQYVPLYNNDEVSGAQSELLNIEVKAEEIIRAVETSACGAVRRSAPLQVGGTANHWKVVLNPNPAAAHTLVRTVHPVNGTLQLDVLALSGQVVHRETILHTGGQLNHVLELRALPPGTYLVRVRNTTGVGVERLVIQP